MTGQRKEQNNNQLAFFSNLTNPVENAVTPKE